MADLGYGGPWLWRAVTHSCYMLIEKNNKSYMSNIIIIIFI